MMNPKFATRMTQLKQSVEDLVSIEYASSLREADAAESTYYQTLEERHKAEELRNQSRTAGELLDWQGYVEALRMKEMRQLQAWQQALSVVSEKKSALLSAHQDVRRWEQVEGQVVQMVRTTVEKAALHQADEAALNAYGRRMSR